MSCINSVGKLSVSRKGDLTPRWHGNRSCRPNSTWNVGDILPGGVPVPFDQVLLVVYRGLLDHWLNQRSGDGGRGAGVNECRVLLTLSYGTGLISYRNAISVSGRI